MAYEFDGKRYRDASSHQKRWGGRIISELPLRGDERILDLGCGDGALTAELAERVPDGSVLGIDASEGMIRVAEKNALPNLRFQLLDINALASLGEEFDLVFSNATLHWVKDHATLLQNVHNLLSDGGCARFNFAGEGNCSNLLKVLRRAMSLERFTVYFSDFEWPWHMPAVGQYELLVAWSAFQDYRVWPENADHFFSDADEMIAWIEQPSLVPFLASVPQRDKLAFRNFVVEQMLLQTRQTNGRHFETSRRINVLAFK
ncbi:MAG: methyltransferase domain-containing protein [Phycisphaerales bacterium]|nr:MAG: methyltransferase domain-containing protein [Phycisphaerales bacterium]